MFQWNENFFGEIEKIEFDIKDFSIGTVNTKILNNIFGCFERNQKYQITGEMGESIFMKIIIGQISSFCQIKYYFRNVNIIDVWHTFTISPIGNKIIYIPQNLNLIGTVNKFLNQLTLKFTKQQKINFLAYLEIFKQKLEIISNNKIINNKIDWTQMSGGQKKRMIISIFFALAIIQNSSMIIVDGIKGLDIYSRRIFYELFFSNEFNEMFLEYKTKGIKEAIENTKNEMRKDTLKAFLLIIESNHSLIRCLVNHSGIDLKDNKNIIKLRITKNKNLQKVKPITKKVIIAFLHFVYKFVNYKVTKLTKKKDKSKNDLIKVKDPITKIILSHKIKLYNQQIKTIINYWNNLQEYVNSVECCDELLESKQLASLCGEIKLLELKITNIIKKRQLRNKEKNEFN